MQDTAEGFGQPIRQIFEPFFQIQRHLPSPSTNSPLPVVAGPLLALALCADRRIAEATSRMVGLMQQGRISVYLLYSFLTLVAMLVVMFR